METTGYARAVHICVLPSGIALSSNLDVPSQYQISYAIPRFSRLILPGTNGIHGEALVSRLPLPSVMAS